MDNFSNSIDFPSFEKKLEDLIVSYKDELWGVLRYMFHGYIVPLEIQQETLLLRRHLHDLSDQNNFQTSTGILSIEKIEELGNISYITCSYGNTILEIGLELVQDNEWWKYPTTQIHYKDQTYRSVRYNGDVYNHMHHQQTFMDNKYLRPTVDQWLLDIPQAQCISLFHTMHDLPEIVQGDVQYGEKTDKNCENEDKVIVDLIQQKKGNFSPSELHFCAELFKNLESPTSFFKWGEKLNYIKDAMEAFDGSFSVNNYHNNPMLLCYDILERNLPSFLDKEKKYKLHSFTNSKKDIMLSLGELDASKFFFHENKNKLEEIIMDSNDYNKNNLKEIRYKLCHKYEL